MLPTRWAITTKLLPRNVSQQGRPSIATVCLRPYSRSSTKYSPILRGLQRRLQSSIAVEQPVSNPRRRSFPIRALRFTFLSLFFTATGFIIATFPVFRTVNEYIDAPTDAETLSLYTPRDAFSREVNAHILTHPLAEALRKNPAFKESRPHLKIPAAQRPHNLTAGVLAGPDGLVVPPLTFSEEGGKSMVQIFYLGPALCGHPGIVHGGLLATLLDEGLARCCFPALPNRVGMTASLKINYRKPVKAGEYYVLRARTTKVEGRKAWVEGWIEGLPDDFDVGTEEEEWGLGRQKSVEAEILIIEPRQAAALGRIYSTQ